MLRRAWRPRNQNTDVQDWTWGGRNGVSPRFMLNADMCLAFDIAATFPCCTNVNTRPRDDGTNQCDGRDGVLSDAPCGAYPPGHAREEAANAVRLFAQPRDQGGFRPDDGPFFEAFAGAWGKATTNGRTGLRPLAASCASSNPTARPSDGPPPANTPVSRPVSFRAQENYFALTKRVILTAAVLFTFSCSYRTANHAPNQKFLCRSDDSRHQSN